MDSRYKDNPLYWKSLALAGLLTGSALIFGCAKPDKMVELEDEPLGPPLVHQPEQCRDDPDVVPATPQERTAAATYEDGVIINATAGLSIATHKKSLEKLIEDPRVGIKLPPGQSMFLFLVPQTLENILGIRAAERFMEVQNISYFGYRYCFEQGVVPERTFTRAVSVTDMLRSIRGRIPNISPAYAGSLYRHDLGRELSYGLVRATLSVQAEINGLSPALTTEVLTPGVKELIDKGLPIAVTSINRDLLQLAGLI